MTSSEKEFIPEITNSEISERDAKFAELFQKVVNAVTRIEEKTRQLEANGGNADVDDIKDAKERLLELRVSLDKLQTSAIVNPRLQTFAKKVVRRAREMSQKLEELTEEELKTEMDELHEIFKSFLLT